VSETAFMNTILQSYRAAQDAALEPTSMDVKVQNALMERYRELEAIRLGHGGPSTDPNLLNAELDRFAHGYDRGPWHILEFSPPPPGAVAEDGRPAAPPLVVAGADSLRGGWDGRLEALGLFHIDGHLDTGAGGLHVSDTSGVDVYRVQLRDGSVFVLTPRQVFRLNHDGHDGSTAVSYGGQIAAGVNIHVGENYQPIELRLGLGPDVVLGGHNPGLAPSANATAVWNW
jgi:hypothetical protein